METGVWWSLDVGVSFGAASGPSWRALDVFAVVYLPAFSTFKIVATAVAKVSRWFVVKIESDKKIVPDFDSMWMKESLDHGENKKNHRLVCQRAVFLLLLHVANVSEAVAGIRRRGIVYRPGIGGSDPLQAPRKPGRSVVKFMDGSGRLLHRSLQRVDL